MQTSYISTQSLWNAPRTSVNRMQAEAAKATQEVATGRYADVGLTLGQRTSVSLGLRQQQAQLEGLIQDNALTTLRLDQTQTTLKQIQADADSTLKTLLAAPVGQQLSSIATIAGSRLAALTTALNGSSNGQYLFAGTNVGQAPLTAYAGMPASPARTAVDQAFADAFGGIALDAITPEQMTDFLADGGGLASLFDAAGWAGTWSSASGDALTSRIAPEETATTSVSANAEPVRKLAMAYVLAAGIGATGLSAETQDVVAKKVQSLLDGASRGLVALQADIGTVQARIKDANTRMDTQTSLIETRIGDLESVDPAEAKTRYDSLETQIKMSYSLTSQLRQLSIINYL
ncbi:flagellar hook-associated family protein [Methylobacterium sp. ID0610]|uniref:flagellar hook-associated family protein n=1 Tax=Methylobacterium carpenticola TaxID=3344827 RepID=UPI0036B3A139